MFLLFSLIIFFYAIDSAESKVKLGEYGKSWHNNSILC